MASWSGFQRLALRTATAPQGQLPKQLPECHLQRSGDYPQVPGSGLQNLVEHFAGPGAAQAHELLSSMDWECLFKVRLQQVDFFV